MENKEKRESSIPTAKNVEPERISQFLADLDRVYRPVVWRVCRWIYRGKQATAEDCTQETMLKLIKWILAGNVLRQGQEEAFVRRMAVNTCLDQMKKEKTQRALLVADAKTTQDHSDPLVEAIRRDNKAILKSCLEEITDPVLHMLLMTVKGYGESSLADIARAMELPYTTLRDKRNRVLKALKECLEEKGVTLFT